MANPNVSNRSTQTYYTGPIGTGTVLTEPVTYASTTGATSTLTLPAAATDATTTQALANAIRTLLISRGIASA